MKKLMILFMFFPVLVFGMTCDNVKDTQTSDSRNLVCDSEKSTVTTFRTQNENVVLSNGVCEIKCTEEIVFSVDPIKKVLSGMSFNYPLYTSGIRKCSATYKYSEYENTIRRLVNEYASLTGAQKATKANELSNYYGMKKKCDEFTKNGSNYEEKYSYNGDVNLKIETSTNEVNVNYLFKPISEYISNVIVDEVSYDSCNYNETGRTCRNGDKTIAGWTETVNIYGKYTMDDVYLEKYTGKVVEAYNDKTCNAGDRFFTDLKEITKPVSGDTRDNGYKLTLSSSNLDADFRELGQKNGVTGTQLPNKLDWKLNVECSYQVKNLVFPQKIVGGSEDENYDKYGNNAFQYRLIDLSNPFPEREPGANWVGNEDIIDYTKNNLSTLEKFRITLNRSSINKIRDYNKVYKYDSFNMDEKDISKFIEANQEIIVRR